MQERVEVLAVRPVEVPGSAAGPPDLAGVPPDLAEVPSDLVVQANYSVADLTRCAAGKRETAAWAAEAAGENGG